VMATEAIHPFELQKRKKETTMIKRV
jgi:hypothetical protein